MWHQKEKIWKGICNWNILVLKSTNFTTGLVELLPQILSSNIFYEVRIFFWSAKKNWSIESKNLSIEKWKRKLVRRKRHIHSKLKSFQRLLTVKLNLAFTAASREMKSKNNKNKTGLDPLQVLGMVVLLWTRLKL